MVFYPLFGKDGKEKTKNKNGRTHSNISKAGRKLMPYHQYPDLFSEVMVQLEYIYFFKKDCFRNMKVHFPYLTTLILFFFEIVFEIQFLFFISKKLIPQFCSSVGDNRLTAF